MFILVKLKLSYLGKPYKYNYENKRRKLETQQDRTSQAYCHDTVIKLAVEQKNQGQLKIGMEYGGIRVDSFFILQGWKNAAHAKQRLQPEG